MPSSGVLVLIGVDKLRDPRWSVPRHQVSVPPFCPFICLPLSKSSSVLKILGVRFKQLVEIERVLVGCFPLFFCSFSSV